MQTSDISPRWIEELLETHRKGQPLPVAIHQLDCLRNIPSDELEAAAIALLHDHITRELSRRRALHKIVPVEGAGRAVDVNNIEQDARTKDTALIVWTFAYYRYVSPGLSVKEVSYAARCSEENHRRKIRVAYEHLVRHVQLRETEAHVAIAHEKIEAQAGRPEYVQYIGMDELLERLVTVLLDDEGPRWVSLEGLGGIGKTALARRVTQEITRQNPRMVIFWLSARQQRFDASSGVLIVPNAALTAEDLAEQLWDKAMMQSDIPLSVEEKIVQLTEWVSHVSALIVIDNLETLEDIAAIQVFQPLAASARFLVTTRESMQWMPQIVSYTIPELSPEDGELLLRREYQERKRLFFEQKFQAPKDLQRIPLKPEHFTQIRQTVGGFPLALKLVAAQILTMPIDECLMGLKNVTMQKRSEDMFTYIYRQTWGLLSEDARLFLLAIHDTLPQEGLALDWFGAMAEAVALQSEQFETVMAHLRYYSLLETTPHDQRYRLHRLTITFIQNEFRDGGGS